jgi:hypothetical protein
MLLNLHQDWGTVWIALKDLFWPQPSSFLLIRLKLHVSLTYDLTTITANQILEQWTLMYDAEDRRKGTQSPILKLDRK